MQIGSSTQTIGGEKKKYDPLPDGRYLVSFDRAEEVATKAGNGSYVKSSFKVLDGESKGRLIFHNFLINHPTARAAHIGREQITKMLKALNVGGGFEALGGDASQLEGYLGQELVLEVTTRNDATYGASNVVKKWIRK